MTSGSPAGAGEPPPTALQGPGPILALHLLPGVAVFAGYAALAGLFGSRGLSNAFALYLAAIVVEVPVLWGVMIAYGRREPGPGGLAAIFPWRRKLRWWWYVLVGLPLVLVSVVVIGGLASTLGEPVRVALFGWWPDVLVLEMDPAAVSGSGGGVALWLWVLGFVGPVALAGPTQELYFRGFLLPRMSRLGRWAPVANAALFAVYHFASPWSWPMFFLGSLIWAALVYRTRSVRIGLFIHVGMLALMWLSMTLLVFGVVTPP